MMHNKLDIRFPFAYQMINFLIKQGKTEKHISQQVGLSQALISKLRRTDVDPRMSTYTKILNYYLDVMHD